MRRDQRPESVRWHLHPLDVAAAGDRKEAGVGIDLETAADIVHVYSLQVNVSEHCAVCIRVGCRRCGFLSGDHDCSYLGAEGTEALTLSFEMRIRPEGLKLDDLWIAKDRLLDRRTVVVEVWVAVEVDLEVVVAVEGRECDSSDGMRT